VRSFARSGFDVTTAEIARDIGIPKSVIYHYFDDKPTLVREAQRFAYTEHLERLRAFLSADGGGSGSAVLETLRRLWRTPEARGLGFQLGIWSELRGDPRVREIAAALRREHHRLIAVGVARALGTDPRDPGRTEPLATLLTAALTGLALNAHLEGESATADAAHEELVRLLGVAIEQFGRRPDSELPPEVPGIDSDLPPPYDAILPGAGVRFPQ